MAKSGKSRTLIFLMVVASAVASPTVALVEGVPVETGGNTANIRVFTLEDLYGDTGNTFQGALGFTTLQGSVGFPAKGGFGEAIDDMVVEWREFTLEPDATDCDAGSCATVVIDTDRSFTGEQIVTYRLMDQSPYGYYCDATGEVCYPNDAIGRAPCAGSCIAGWNDCDGNGLFNDPGDDDDCDDNGKSDVIVLLRSQAEPLGERTVANEIGTGVYEGSIVTTALGDSPGVLFVAQIGADNPTVTATYADNDDGTGNICENSIVPELQGFVQDASVILFDEVCSVLISGFEFQDNGDSDAFADTNETGTVTLELINACEIGGSLTALTNCLMRITSNSPEVDCIFNPIVAIADLPCSGGAPCTLPPGESVQAPPFQFRVASDVQGSDPNHPPVITFVMTMSCDQMDGIDIPQSFGLAADLDIAFNPADQTSFRESFEGAAGSELSSGGTTFFAQNNDFGIPGSHDSEGLINGDGYRCQYSDPDWPNSDSSGYASEATCFPGTRNNADPVWWQIDGQNIVANLADNGRAKDGTRSMYYGKYDEVPHNPDATDPFVITTPMAVVEAAATIDPINLGVEPSPILSWWQQISLADGRGLNVGRLRSADRGVVQIQWADGDDSPIGDWIKLVPFQNSYDTQAFSNYFNCMFDPIDDGNTEDDFFDPTDPNRRLGPSSTCFGALPGGTTDFTWSCIGDTGSPFATTHVCNGDTPPLNSDRPDWPPNTIDNTGTWLQSKVDLSAYKGRRVRVRYLVSSLKGNGNTWEEDFSVNPIPLDDGWWIDDININSTLINPADITVDTKANDTLPACGAACTSLSAVVTVVSERQTCDAGGDGSALGEPCVTDSQCEAVTPGSTCRRVVNPGTVVLDAPGQVIQLNALGFDHQSEADRCHNGALQFQFVRDAVVARAWTEDAVFIDAPAATTVYDVQVRCSTDPTCTDTQSITAQVTCPATGKLRRFSEVVSDAPGSFLWEVLFPATVDNDEVPGVFQVYRGALDPLPTFAGSVVASGQIGTEWTDPAVLAGSSYYLFARDGDRSGLGCNALPFSWSSGGGAEVNRDDNATLSPP